MKLYISLALISIGLIGGALALLFTLGASTGNAFKVFSPYSDSTSLTPILFGILTISGVWLLSSIKDEIPDI